MESGRPTATGSNGHYITRNRRQGARLAGAGVEMAVPSTCTVTEGLRAAFPALSTAVTKTTCAPGDNFHGTVYEIGRASCRERV